MSLFSIDAGKKTRNLLQQLIHTLNNAPGQWQ